MLKITDLTLQDLSFYSLENRYNLLIKEEDTIADVIFRFLFSDQSVVQIEGSDDTPEELKRYYFESLKKQVSKGAPIDFFLTTFSPKFKKSDISNGWIEPDIADFITLVHLQLIAKTIREIYPYNFRFIIAFKGDLYKRIGDWSDAELDRTFNILLELNLAAEKITGTRNSIILKRWSEMFGNSLGEFESSHERKTEYYYRLWKDQKEPYKTQIEEWKDNFKPYLEYEEKTEEIFDFFLTKEACRIRAFNNLIFREGKALEDFQNLNPNMLIAHTSKKSKFFNLMLNPHFQNRTHLKMTTLEENDEWDMKRWEDIKGCGYKPIYIDEFNFPFYFEKEKTE